MSYLRIIVGFFFISGYPRHSTVLCFLLVQQNLFSYLLNMNTLCQTLGTKSLTKETRSLLNKFTVLWKKEGMDEGIRECIQLLSRVRLFATPWIAAHQASLSIINSQCSPKLMSIKSVMPSNHLILCRPLLLLPPIPPSIRVFSSESTLRMRWPKYWSLSFSISPSNEHPGLISFRMDWLDLLAVQGTLKSLLQHHSSKASILQCSAFFTIRHVQWTVSASQLFLLLITNFFLSDGDSGASFFHQLLRKCRKVHLLFFCFIPTGQESSAKFYVLGQYFEKDSGFSPPRDKMYYNTEYVFANHTVWRC